MLSWPNVSDEAAAKEQRHAVRRTTYCTAKPTLPLTHARTPGRQHTFPKSMLTPAACPEWHACCRRVIPAGLVADRIAHLSSLCFPSSRALALTISPAPMHENRSAKAAVTCLDGEPAAVAPGMPYRSHPLTEATLLW